MISLAWEIAHGCIQQPSSVTKEWNSNCWGAVIHDCLGKGKFGSGSEGSSDRGDSGGEEIWTDIWDFPPAVAPRINGLKGEISLRHLAAHLFLPKKMGCLQPCSSAYKRWSTALDIDELEVSAKAWATNGMKLPSSNTENSQCLGSTAEILRPTRYTVRKYPVDKRKTCYQVLVRLLPFESELSSLLLKAAENPFKNDSEMAKRRMMFAHGCITSPSLLHKFDFDAIIDLVKKHLNGQNAEIIEKMLRADMQYLFMDNDDSLSAEDKLDIMNCENDILEVVTKIVRSKNKNANEKDQWEEEQDLTTAQELRTTEINAQWNAAMKIFEGEEDEEINFLDLAAKVPNVSVRMAVVLVLAAEDAEGGPPASEAPGCRAYIDALLRTLVEAAPRKSTDVVCRTPKAAFRGALRELRLRALNWMNSTRLKFVRNKVRLLDEETETTSSESSASKAGRSSRVRLKKLRRRRRRSQLRRSRSRSQEAEYLSRESSGSKEHQSERDRRLRRKVHPCNVRT